MITGKSVATLVIFILSIVFVICPISIPLRGTRHRIHINLTTAPIAAIVILWAAQCIEADTIKDGIVGTDGVKPYKYISYL